MRRERARPGRGENGTITGRATTCKWRHMRCTRQARPCAADARGSARAHRAADRAGRPPAARAGAHTVLGLQHLQPAGVLSRSGHAERTRRPGSLELHGRQTDAACATRSTISCRSRPASASGPTRRSRGAPSELHPLLRRAAAAWKEPKYRELADRDSGEGASRAQSDGTIGFSRYEKGREGSETVRFCKCDPSETLGWHS